MGGPSGERFADDDEHLAQRCPKLWQRFGVTQSAHFDGWYTYCH
jgi:hypothetical protein